MITKNLFVEAIVIFLMVVVYDRIAEAKLSFYNFMTNLHFDFYQLLYNIDELSFTQLFDVYSGYFALYSLTVFYLCIFDVRLSVIRWKKLISYLKRWLPI